MRIIEKKNVYLLYSAITHTILNDKYYFSTLTLCKANTHTISGPVEMIDYSKNATLISPNATTLHIEDLLLNNRSNRNLLTFRDVH